MPRRHRARPAVPTVPSGSTALLGATALFALLVGCGGSDEPAAGPKVEVVTGHAAPKKGAFDTSSFTCCTDATHTALLQSFVELGDALAADDVARSQAAAKGFSAAAQAATPAPPTPAIAEAAGRAASLTELIDIREAYLDASQPALELARASKGGELTLAVAFCPMKPGRWLQTKEPLANPYYGAEMLRCGVFEGL